MPAASLELDRRVLQENDIINLSNHELAVVEQKCKNTLDQINSLTKKSSPDKKEVAPAPFSDTQYLKDKIEELTRLCQQHGLLQGPTTDRANATEENIDFLDNIVPANSTATNIRKSQSLNRNMRLQQLNSKNKSISDILSQKETKLLEQKDVLSVKNQQQLDERNSTESDSSFSIVSFQHEENNDMHVELMKYVRVKNQDKGTETDSKDFADDFTQTCPELECGIPQMSVDAQKNQDSYINMDLNSNAIQELPLFSGQSAIESQPESSEDVSP